MRPPEFNLDLGDFWNDPYPELARMRSQAPICYVPQLDAILLAKRNDISECEKNIEVFSSHQPDGLMNKLMGHNMMRKDGEAHLQERKQVFPTISPKTVKNHWKAIFEEKTDRILDRLAEAGGGDLCREYALPVSGEALCAMTGLTNLTYDEMDFVSQAMIDGIANYVGDAEIEARCHKATGRIDAAIDEMMQDRDRAGAFSMLNVALEANMTEESIRANIKLTISGGQNEPRDAIAGTIWALLTHPDQLALVRSGEVSWLSAFEEYARWISPIGMSPRRIARDYAYHGIEFSPERRAFFMFGSGNRDEEIFDSPEQFDVTRDNAKSIAFGAGPHFCAGAWASRCLIGEVALPKFFERFPSAEIAGEVPFGGWAFRGALKLPVACH